MNDADEKRFPYMVQQTVDYPWEAISKEILELFSQRDEAIRLLNGKNSIGYDTWPDVDKFLDRVGIS